MEYRPRGVRIEDSRKLSYEDRESPEAYGDDEEERSVRLRQPSESEVTEYRDPFVEGQEDGFLTRGLQGRLPRRSFSPFPCEDSPEIRWIEAIKRV